jgi:hypothetical protein
MALSVAVDLNDQPGRQCVDNRDAHTVEAARHLVATAAKFAASMQYGEDDLCGRLPCMLASFERVDRDTATVIAHSARAICGQRNGDLVAVTGHGLVNRVVNDLPDQVVEALEAGGTDVHTWAFAHRVKAFEHRDGVSAVRSVGLCGIARDLFAWLRRRVLDGCLCVI